MHIYIHTCIYTNIHTYTCMYTHLHIYIYTYLHIYIYTYLHICTSTHIHTYIYTYIHTYIHTYMHKCIHVYIYTCIRISIYSRMTISKYTIACLFLNEHIPLSVYVHIPAHKSIRSLTSATMILWLVGQEEITEADERAMRHFLAAESAPTRTLADIIMAKIREKEMEAGIAPSHPGGRRGGARCGLVCIGFRFQVSGFRVQGSGFRVQGSGFKVQGSGLRVEG